MADIEAVEVLTQAKERLFECGWTTGALCERVNKSELCLEEALAGRMEYVSCSDNPAARRAGRYVRQAIGSWKIGREWPLFEWNDSQESVGPVFDVIDRALEIAKESTHASGVTESLGFRTKGQ